MMRIRNVQTEDAFAINRILRDLSWFPHINEEPEQATDQRIRQHIALCQQDDSHTIFVAENEQGEVVGYTAIHWLPYLILKAPEGYVSELFIAGSERGKGVGSKLLEAVKEEAMKRGCARLMLLNLKNRESYQRGFYKKQGWVEREEVANFVLRLDQ